VILVKIELDQSAKASLVLEVDYCSVWKVILNVMTSDFLLSELYRTQRSSARDLYPEFDRKGGFYRLYCVCLFVCPSQLQSLLVRNYPSDSREIWQSY